MFTIFFFLTSVLGLICLFVTFTAIPIIMIAMGLKYSNVCPAIPRIPQLLIATGSLMITSNVINMFDHILTFCYTPPSAVLTSTYWVRNLVMFTLNVILNGLVLAGLLSMSAWIHGSPEPSVELISKNYCEPNLYFFACAIVYFMWAFATIAFIVLLVVCCLLTCS